MDEDNAALESIPSGFALPAAIGVIVTLGILLTAGFFMAQQELRMGVATENAVTAFYVAERAAGEVIESWDNSLMEAMPLFGITTFTGATPEGEWSVDVRRVGRQQYLLFATGEITRGGSLLGGASHGVGMFVRHLALGIEPAAAVTTRGGISFNGRPPRLIGHDSVPEGWGGICTNALQDKIGFLSTDTTRTIQPGTGASGVSYCGNYIDGDPCVEEDIPLVDETLEPFYDTEYWQYLIDLADHRLSTDPPNLRPSVSGGECDYADPANWGEIDDPASACGGYFPLIYLDHSASLSGSGEGQGILLVDGDLNWGGIGRYVGLVVVKGTFTSAGSPTITGALIAESVNAISGSPTLQYSSCGIERALTGNRNLARVHPLTHRAFVDLSVIGN